LAAREDGAARVTDSGAPSPDLRGLKAFVTGAAKRTGKGLALALARHGADVFIHYRRSKAEADAVVAEIAALGRSAEALQADFEDPKSVERLLDALKKRAPLSIVVNNVGDYLVKPILDTTVDEWRSLLEANLLAPIAIMRGVFPLFPKTGGSIVNLGYAGVERVGVATKSAAYQATKTALLVATKSFAAAGGPRGIRVNMVSPGQLDNSVDLPADPARVIPLGRPGTVEDVAKALLFLVDPKSYVTGVNLDVAGGYRMGMLDGP
jgi:3-oxoacyl-[acyl-carrier protein] reductase